MLITQELKERIIRYTHAERIQPRYMLLGHEEYAMLTHSGSEHLYFTIDRRLWYLGIEVLEVDRETLVDLVR